MQNFDGINDEICQSLDIFTTLVELKRQLKEERTRAVTAESELASLKEFHNNAVYHKDGIIKNLQNRLDAAEARVEELEALYCSNS